MHRTPPHSPSSSSAGTLESTSSIEMDESLNSSDDEAQLTAQKIKKSRRKSRHKPYIPPVSSAGMCRRDILAASASKTRTTPLISPPTTAAPTAQMTCACVGGGSFVFKHEINRLVCTACGVTRVHVAMIEGVNADANNDYHINNHANDGRLKAYQRLLEPFGDDVVMPSDAILNEIVVRLHQKNPHFTKIKQTHINEIVIDLGHSELRYMSLRLMWLIERGHVYTISNDLMQRLVDRFRKMQNVFIHLKNNSFKDRIKIISFKFCTRQFLFMEGRPEIARQFEGLKTQRLFQEDKRMHSICEYINNTNQTDGMKWFVTPSI